ncbi:hypothetical protein GGQ73_003057 [Rhizobium skierniewicense]|uniref:Uncharacterized protein n=1 Tax=Rhizobium skierniewicense TaxID=984260 RepID=A0A7W6C7B7_9HYPH|nr:hypothetical protein [Rhizobium skierniewicense]MBB3947093.1 hypothetical protein [Rhizobium skierniewicense]
MSGLIIKSIGTATVEIGSIRDFGSLTLIETIGKIGPFTLSRNISGVGFELSAEDELFMRISIKDILMKCAQEFAAEIERRKALPATTVQIGQVAE